MFKGIVKRGSAAVEPQEGGVPPNVARRLLDGESVGHLDDDIAKASGWGWVARRLFLGTFTVFCVSVVVFVLTQVLPGNPAEAVLGRTATPERVRQLSQQLGLDQSWLRQYWDWISGVLHGDLGQSIAAATPVTSFIGGRLVNTLVLVVIAAGIALPLAAALGSYSAARRGRIVDEVISLASLVVASLPEFVIGLLLVFVFATGLIPVLPAVSLISPGESPLADWRVLVLPAATLVLAATPYPMRIVRGSMVDILESEYVRMARLKGMPERVVVRRHALRNALVPFVQVSALELAWMAGGIVLVEFVFQYPGVGSALAEAVSKRDLPVIQAIVLLLATMYVVLNLVADVLTVLLSPRLRTGMQGE